jgi:hypothetical protein
MANCPDNKKRSEVFNIFNKYLSIFKDELKFELIKNIINSCPYESFVKYI